ncbi:hypothetical protein K402DRAFT_418988 [Aulographum hederae CBS 113979]|uniref:SnoaL-like domain-containing protein n=1 Tax=Aulographum hederae CBS 113979 TaxID=1176131 RepID=A0A6G1H7Z6_9PEZI|nr:hypothetical protein K402DRAFT_418988 [Aulographum hederae CBS 113979]
MESTLSKTALDYIRGFETLSADDFRSLHTSTFEHVFAPASLNMPPTLDGASFANHIAGLRGIMHSFPVIPKETIVNEKGRQVVVWATSIAKFIDDVKDDSFSEDEWAYRGEYIFMFTMIEAGDKIDRVVEFLDSKSTDTLRLLMETAKKNKARKEEA